MLTFYYTNGPVLSLKPQPGSVLAGYERGQLCLASDLAHIIFCALSFREKRFLIYVQQ